MVADVRSVADKISTVEVIGEIAFDVFRAIRNKNVKGLLLRDGCGVGLAELTKHFVKETRPDGSDRKSFFSEHTDWASVSSFPHGAAFGIVMTVNIASLRVVARKHFVHDVLVGAAVGYGCSLLDRK